MSRDTKRKFVDEFLNSGHSKKKTTTQGVPNSAFLDDEDWTAENIQDILGKDFFDDNPYHRSNGNKRVTNSSYNSNPILNQNKKNQEQSQKQHQSTQNKCNNNQQIRNQNQRLKSKQVSQQRQQRYQQLDDKKPIINNKNTNNNTHSSKFNIRSTNSILNQDDNRKSYKQLQSVRQNRILQSNKNKNDSGKAPRYSVNYLFTVGSNGLLLNTQELHSNTIKLQGSQNSSSSSSSNSSKKNSISKSEELICTDDIEALLNSKSSHEEEAHTEWMESYSKKLDKLAGKEGIKNKENEQKVVQVEVFRCEICKLTSENILDNCVRQRHQISRITAQKRYFECRGCHFRIHTIGPVKLPARACQCGMYNWMATGKWGTSERFSSTYVAPSRPD